MTTVCDVAGVTGGFFVRRTTIINHTYFMWPISPPCSCRSQAAKRRHPSSAAAVWS